MIIRKLSILPFVVPLGACAVGPDYQTPKAELASSFADGGTAPIGDVAAQRWWLDFNDPMLNDLVATGLSQNLDVRTVLTRVSEAQAAARATGLPAHINGSVTTSATRSGGSDIAITTTESASFNPSFVLDLFGGGRRTREQALALLQSAELDVGTARLAFVSSLTTNYIDMRYYQAALAFTRQTISNRRETLQLVRNQRQVGSATELSIAQAQADLNDAEASLPALEGGFYASAYAIATLIAKPVQDIETRLERGAGQPVPRGAATTGVPADLLRNRPDIRSAEHDFAAAVAAIGVSEADLYPSLTLGGTVSASDTRTWSFGPTLTLPVLSQGVLRANRDRAIAQAEAAQLTWQSTVLNAVEEVQVAQSDVLRNRRTVAATRRSVESYARVVDLSRKTFEAGTTTLLDLLDSERQLANANLSLASANRNLAASWASMKVASGQGWRTTPAGN